MLCSAGLATALCAFQAHAQESALRGTFGNGTTLRNTPRGQQALTNTTNQPGAEQAQLQYEPMSSGAVPDTQGEAGSANLFGTVASGGDPFAETPLPAQRSTRASRQRAQQAPVSAERALPEEAVDEATTGTVRVPTIDSTLELPANERAERIGAIEGLRRATDDNPFAATGMRLGSFVLRPSLEQGITATSNASLSTSGSSAVLSETTLRLNAVSDWSRHAATIDAYGILRRSLSGEEIDETEAGINARLDLDLAEEMRGHGEFGYLRRPESASSPVVIEGTASQPIRQTFGGGLGLERDVGKLRFGVTGRVERDVFGDAELSSGGVLSQKERDSILATLTLRGGYEISPALTPFVETEIGRRYYDEEIDSSGFARSSDRLGARAGIELDLGEKLSGEFAAGWLRETFDDERLKPISGPSIDAALAWSPERGTLVNLAANTIIEGTTTAGESGSILHSGRLSLDRQIRADLTANAALGLGYRDYSGSDGYDVIFNAEAGATWWINRYAGLSGRLRHESQKSNLSDRDYDANSVFLGLRLQR
ncbi:outer membrane beta-barrel protein [Borborobacter arsenicus]|uniref:outer membrane beta-barrel protein n=1 Tax=Borborobacter arsenicus TaxID=1851146 RepID=UPI00315D869E